MVAISITIIGLPVIFWAKYKFRKRNRIIPMVQIQLQQQPQPEVSVEPNDQDLEISSRRFTVSPSTLSVPSNLENSLENRPRSPVSVNLSNSQANSLSRPEPVPSLDEQQAFKAEDRNSYIRHLMETIVCLIILIGLIVPMIYSVSNSVETASSFLLVLFVSGPFIFPSIVVPSVFFQRQPRALRALVELIDQHK